MSFVLVTCLSSPLLGRRGNPTQTGCMEKSMNREEKILDQVMTEARERAQEPTNGATLHRAIAQYKSESTVAPRVFMPWRSKVIVTSFVLTGGMSVLFWAQLPRTQTAQSVALSLSPHPSPSQFPASQGERKGSFPTYPLSFALTPRHPSLKVGTRPSQAIAHLNGREGKMKFVIHLRKPAPINRLGSPFSRPAKQEIARERGEGRGREISDDLAFLNPDANQVGYATRVAEFVRMDGEGLLQNIPIPKNGDSFVDVPVPLIASVNNAGAADAIRMYQEEKAVVDPRLQRRMTISQKAIAFSDLIAMIKKETGIEIAVAKNISDDKLTIFCTNRPLRDIMREITEHFGFVWERRGTDPEWRYQLKQSLRAQLLEEELRNKDRNEALLALDKEMDAFKKYLDMSPEQARIAAENAKGEDKERLDKLGGFGWGGAQLYHGLGGEDKDALFAGNTLSFGAGNEDSAGRPLSPELQSGILNAMQGYAFVTPEGSVTVQGDRNSPKAKNQSGVSPSAVPGVTGFAQMSMGRSELGEYQIQGVSGFQAGGAAASSSVVLATGISPSAASPDNAKANKAKKNDPKLQKLTKKKKRRKKKNGRLRTCWRRFIK
jgi:hypothetical protein